MQIGKLKIDFTVGLAPMAGVTDLPFRVLCRRLGAGFVVSEMISAKALLYHNEKTFAMLRIAPQERPVGLQLFGSEPAEVAQAAKIVEASGADFIDFNMGCPVHKVVSNGEGSALMRDGVQAGHILTALCEAVSIPVTVKIRTGWDEEHINAAEIAHIAQEAGISAIAVHGRTRSQFYSGVADWETIRKVKESVTVPVFGNGDITSAERAQHFLKVSGVDGLLIGRGADGNPWLFSEVRACLTGQAMPVAVSFAERAAVMLEHLDSLIDFKGEAVAIREMRQHATMYVKGLSHAAKYRNLFCRIKSREELVGLLAQYDAELTAEEHYA